MRRSRILYGLILVAFLPILGCSPGTTSYVRDDVDFSFVQRVAIHPFENLSQDANAGARVRAVFSSELLATEALSVIDIGETVSGLEKLRLNGAAALSTEQIVALGKELEVDGIFFGSVQDYGQERLGQDRAYAITLTFSLAETQTGMIVWDAQVHEDGTSFWRKLFGGGSASMYDVSREAVQNALDTLF